MIKIKKTLLFTFFISIGLIFATNAVQAKSVKTQKTGCAVDAFHLGLVDQEQCKSSGNLSARTTPYYQIWQSFTAGTSGDLTEIDLGFEGPINSGKGTLTIVEGEGVGGAGLGSTITYVSCDGGKCMTAFNFDTPVQVIEGNIYTFVFSPGYGMPDPYGIQVGAHNPYHEGTMGTYMPVTGSTGVLDTYDMVFTTFVN